MKRKVTQMMISGAKHLMRARRSEYESAGALVRQKSRQAAEQCARLGRNTDVQFHKSLKEFLAFFSVIVLNEIALKAGHQHESELREHYAKLVQAVCAPDEDDPEPRDFQLTVRRVMTYPGSGFDHWFYGYWNADFEGMRITEADLAELQARQAHVRTGNYCADAGLILLVRVARLQNPHVSVPPPDVLARYDQTIRAEVAGFVRSLKDVLG